MSGGSYNYLYIRDWDDLITRNEDLEEMQTRLEELSFKDVAKDTEELILEIAAFKEKLELKLASLRQVWRAVEYYDSNDSGLSSIEKAVEDYRNERV